MDIIAKTFKTNEEFVKIWETSSSAKEAAERAGIPPKTASAHASVLRQQGVALKMFRASNKSVDVTGLNELISGLDKGDCNG